MNSMGADGIVGGRSLTGGSRLARVDVADDHDVDMTLLFLTEVGQHDIFVKI